MLLGDPGSRALEQCQAKAGFCVARAASPAAQADSIHCLCELWLWLAVTGLCENSLVLSLMGDLGSFFKLRAELLQTKCFVLCVAIVTKILTYDQMS